jgi:TRAP-type C4-dicarboxylate transport system substrate-binding protein
MYLIGIFTIDTKTFKKLRPEDQAILREEIAAASERLDTNSRLGDANAMEALRNQGIEFVMASSPEEVERWHDISVRALERLRGLNRYSEALLDEMIDYVEAYRAQNPPVSNATGKLEKPAAPGFESK